ncbi:hypothetical protein PYW07_007610 [Mythimna separata]|uniref:Integrator complex subunit 1 INTS2-binding domain-containing protein n=1 Tax=Mythimna separata TaxID=271217 RepID=A0AAD7YR77_MYTSE|nr:hypothetical protein PYW07_007607 [Mythimna separata]KAJ8723628.1 hypothetical protein PYW07_007608 [Mythimna separata]KAJ8723629.1 hypothetical protein PYW07_007609 [Mythimna separata]KAJ8723630.1 hypothetical protein PYW07_007610 [Mythimna separata]
MLLTLDSMEETCLLPDWLRLHMVRSARTPLLEAGMRGLPAPKLAIFIQTFGMPVTAMSMEETCLLPDWLRLHMVRSARTPLLEAGMRGLPAPKLAIFIQTFGMPVTAMR